ncbi:MAG: AtpZ/AtpI family protein [Deltaproteobacteria bacterium]|nr:AtpZ/AtpI family protein [Deltaproteobacteria bacterium]
MSDKGKNGEGLFKSLAMLSSMGIAMVASTFIGLLIGIYLDKWFHTSPWLTIIFLILGIVAGFKNIYEMIKKYGSSAD